MERDLFGLLFEKYLKGDLTADEFRAFQNFVNKEDNRDRLDQMLETAFQNKSLKISGDYDIQEVFKEFLMKIQKEEAPIISVSKRRFPAWAAVAAGILVLFGIASIINLLVNTHKVPIAAKDKPVQTDIAPGGNKATLTLANGSKIILDSAVNGKIATQGNANVEKLKNGELTYTASTEKPSEVLYNTLSTPRGGQYQLTLPDGTRVWLNSASSIRYPTAFIGNVRNVEITGEAYFEVFKNASEPFKVNVNGKATVDVLGTHFNVNAYADEQDIKATLLEGSVRVTVTGSTDQHPAGRVVLQPGEQAIVIGVNTNNSVKGEPTAIIKKVDVDEVIAWKNGEILLSEESVEMIMRQISRWYDVDVRYSGTIGQRRFNGMIDRNVRLSSVLSVLTAYGIHSRLEGKTLTISP